MVLAEVIEVAAIPGFREPFSSFTHLIGAGVFAVLSWPLILRCRGHWGRRVALGVFAFTAVFLLSMSGVYHLLGEGSGREVLKRLDVAGVFALIAGTFTAVHALVFRGWMRWGPIVLVWVIVGTGVPLRTVFFDQTPAWLGLGIFLAMGWLGAMTTGVLWRRHGWVFARPVVFGGLAYTLGAVFYATGWPTLVPNVIASHELWHITVLTGLGLHWSFVYRLAKRGEPISTGSMPLDVYDQAA